MAIHNQRTKIDQNYRSTFLVSYHSSCGQLKGCCPSIVFTPKPWDACGAEKQTCAERKQLLRIVNSVGEDTIQSEFAPVTEVDEASCEL